MVEYCAHNDCIDPARGIMRMRTKPMEGRRIPRSEKNQRRLTWYEAQVPNWQEGIGLVMLFRLDPVHIARSWIRSGRPFY
jgi:hypothetical protein